MKAEFKLLLLRNGPFFCRDILTRDFTDCVSLPGDGSALAVINPEYI